MTNRKTDWISARAYSLWENSGREHGQDSRHWQQAVNEYEQLINTSATADGADVKARWSKNNTPAIPRNKQRKAT